MKAKSAHVPAGTAANAVQCTSAEGLSLTPVVQAAGWAIVIGFGAFFALFASVLVYIDIAFSGEVRSATVLTDLPHG